MASSETVDIIVRLRNSRQFVQGAQQSGKAIGGVGRQADQASKSAARAGGRFSLFRRNLDGSKKSAMGASGALGGAAKSMVGLVAAYAGFGAAKQAITTTIGLAKTTLALKRNLGLTTKEASRWAAVAKARGVDTSSLNTSFVTLSKNVEKARAGGSAAQGTFKSLGITQKDLVRGQTDFSFLLGKVSDGLAGMKGGSERTAAAQALLGKSSADTLPIFTQGSAAMKEQLALADKYGVTLGGKPIKSLKDLTRVQRELEFAQLGWQVAFATKVAPMLVKGADLVLRFSRFYQRNKTAVKAAAIAVLGFVAAVKGIGAAKKGITATSDAIRGIRAAARGTRRVGTMIVDNILPGLRGSPGKIRRALSGAKSTITRILSGAGRTGGNAAANSAASSMSSGMSPALNKRQPGLKTKFASFGRGLGMAAGWAAVVAIAFEIGNKLNDILPKIKIGDKKIAIPINAQSLVSDIKQLPGIPGGASGLRTLGFGSALVGERGPEILNLPPGAMVRPLTPVEKDGGGGASLDLSGGGRGQDIAREIVAALRREPLAVFLDGRPITAGVARHASNARARS